MIKKLCDKCGKFSYSASCLGEWRCPTCGHDLTKRPVMKLQESDIVKKSDNIYTVNFK